MCYEELEASDKTYLRRGIEKIAAYAKTSDEFAHGIRSTPTIILNNRMIIGTLSYEQLRAIFNALVREHEGGRFLENWEETSP